MAITSSYSDASKELTISISGRFDFGEHKPFRDAYSDITGIVSSYKIDMAQTEYLDSSALGMLLMLREHAGGDAAKISLSGCRADVKQILEVSRFDSLFNIV